MVNKKIVLIVGWGTETSKCILAECRKLDKYDFYLATTTNILPEIKNIIGNNRIIETNPYDSMVLCEDISKYCYFNKMRFDIITTFFEMCVGQTAFLAEYMGVKNYLPLPSALKTSVNKYLMRLTLERCGIKQPRYFKFSRNSIPEAFRFFKKNFKNGVIKPIHSGHSYGVRFLETDVDLGRFKRYVNEAVSDYNKNYDEWMDYESVEKLEFLLEEFIEGKIFSFDGFINGNSEVEFIGTTEFELSKPPVMQQIGHTSPIYTLTQRQIDNGKNYVKNIVNALGLKYCGFHCELKFYEDNPYLIEISGRLPGAIISRTYQNLSEYNLFDRFFGIFDSYTKSEFIKNKNKFKSESMMVVFTEKRIGVVRNSAESKQTDNPSLSYEIRSRHEGEVLLETNNPFGVWLYDIDVKSKILSSKDLIKKRNSLIKEQKIKVERNLYLYINYFFIIIKKILKKYV